MSVLLRALELANSEAERGNSDFVAELEDPRSPDLWAQATWEHFNVALVGDSLPSLDPMPSCVRVESWAPRTHLTVSHSADDLAELATFFERLIEKCWARIPLGLALKALA
jgi:hypothetical protein